MDDGEDERNVGNGYGLTANGVETALDGDAGSTRTASSADSAGDDADSADNGGYDSGQAFLDGMMDIIAPALEAYREMAGDYDMTGALWRQWSDMMVSLGISPESPAARIPAFIALNIITNDGTPQDAGRTAEDRIDDAIALSMALCEKPDIEHPRTAYDDGNDSTSKDGERDGSRDERGENRDESHENDGAMPAMAPGKRTRTA